MTQGKQTYVVGLTGQSGAGKSTVSRVFVENGFALIDADRIARDVVQAGSPCLSELTDYFGEKILYPDGTLNRRKLANIVFCNRDKLESLNSISHPFITEEIFKHINRYARTGQKLILLDAPTLFESRAADFCDLIISVVADPEQRCRRIMKRDSITKDEALHRMNSQLEECFFIRHSDYVIRNNDNLEQLFAMTKEVADKIKVCYHTMIMENN